ncbi:MAG: Glycerate dehydrogenase [Nitrosomonadaceae bacterium]|nr:Glycerate dehydrogenase [Nitrosomonadaceae bacterium]
MVFSFRVCQNERNMKIVITNESGLTESQIQSLRELGEVEVYSDTNNQNYTERLKHADIAVIDCFLTPVTKEFLSNTPNLKFFTINSTGHDNVDGEAIKHANIVASNVPGFSTVSVAELAIGLMFATVRKISQGDSEFRHGLFTVDPGTPEAGRYMGFNLHGKTLGVIGLGNIGTHVAKIGKGVGMNVIGYNRTPKSIPGVQLVTLDELMAQADVIINCLTLKKETFGYISKELIAKMKKSEVLVTIANLGTVDGKALIEALDNESIAGAGIDTGDASFTGVKNTVLTPHIGYNTRESHENMGRIILENIRGYISGNPVNRI